LAVAAVQCIISRAGQAPVCRARLSSNVRQHTSIVTHFLALSIFDAQASLVIHAALDRLSQYNYRASPVDFPPLPAQNYSPDEPRATVWTPAACPTQCALMGHLPDGWSSLTSIVAKALGVRAVSLRAALPVGPGYVGHFTYWQDGASCRTVIALNDEPWTFYQEGTPLPQEEVSMYKARRISDRVTPAYLARLVTRMGWPVSEPAFWRPGGQAVVLHSDALLERKRSSAA